MIGNRKGFTLIETLVALALFTVVVTVATDVFFMFQKTSRKTENLEKVVSSSKFIIERMAREIRTGTIDYTKYGNQLNYLSSQGTLYLKNSSDQSVAFYVEDDSVACGSSPCFMLEVDGVGENLTGAGLKVKNARFSISPEADPFELDRETGEYLSNKQPMATILLTIENDKQTNNSDYVSYEIQTTISSRVYRR